MTSSDQSVDHKSHIEAPKSLGLALVVICTAQLMVVLDATIVNIALPAAQLDLGFDNANRSWIVTAYALAFGSLLLLGGRLSDILGRRRMFLIGLIGFAGASALGGLADSFGLLIGARALQGVFGAILAPAALSVLTTTFTQPKERARAFGIFGAIAGMGGAIGLLLGGFLTETLTWRWNLYINIPIAIIAFVAGLVLLDGKQARGTHRLEFTGVALGSVGLFSLVYGFSQAEPRGWDHVLTWGPLALSVLLLVGFVQNQRTSTFPVLPLGIVLDRDRGAASSRSSWPARACSAHSSSSPTTCSRCSATPRCKPVPPSCRWSARSS